MKFLLFLSLFITSNCYVLEPLNNLTANLYPVGKSSRVYLIADGTKNQIASCTLYTQNSRDMANGTTLTAPTSTGSLSPFIPTQDNDMMGVVVPINMTGWLYITEQTDLNVYAMSETNNFTINFQPGTNLFFNFHFSTNFGILRIPTANNVVIGDTVSFKGFVGIPENSGVKFFDSASISGLTTYDPLELPLQIFHFKTNGTDIKYDISYQYRHTFTTQSSGLLMTQGFPVQYTSDVSDYDIANFNRDNVKLYMLARFDPSHFYTVNVSLIFKDTTLPNIVFNMNSTSDYIIQSISPFTSVLIESDSPYSIQYWLQDQNIHTTTYYSVTNASSGLNFVLAVLLAAVLNFRR